MLAACEAQAIYFALTGRTPASAVTLAIGHSDFTGAGMPVAQSIGFELVKGLPAAVVALLAAIIGGLIAWRQYRVARAKLNLDLFEKRYELFMVVWAFASTVVQGGCDQLHAPERREMTNLIPKIEFLFGRDLAEYVRHLNAQHASLWAIHQEAKTNNNVIPPQHIEAHNAIMKWFADEALEGVKQRFGLYLNFEQWH